MSLTLPSAFTTKTILKENWLVQLWYDDEAEDKFRGLAFYDTRVEGTDTEDYKGCILNSPTIRESINLEDSTAKTSNVSITIANFIDNDGRKFSTNLLFGSNKFLNRSVKIYIQPDDTDDLYSCLLVYTGRLTTISQTADKINLNIVAQRPWDNISIPNQGDRTTNNIYKPIVYGDYSDNATEGSTNDVYGTYIAHPAKYCTEINRIQYYLTGASSSGTKGALFYDKFLKKFSPIDDSPTTISSILGQNALQYPITSKRSNHFFLDSVRVSPESPASDSNWQDTINILQTGGFAYYSNPAVGSSTTVTKYLYLNSPNIDGEATQLNLVLSMRQEGNVGSGNSLIVRIKYEDDATQLGFKSFSSNESDVVTTNFLTEYTTQSKKMPDYVTIEVSWSAGSSSVWLAGSSQLRIFEARFETEYQFPDLNDDKDNKTQNFVFSGGDGQVSTTDSSAIDEIHDAYIDVLRRYTSYSGTPANYSDGTNLNNARAWKLRYWVLEPMPLIEYLEKLQFEGGFIGRFNGQNSFQLIYIPDSPSVNFNLDADDISDISVSTTDFFSIVSKMEIEYQKHPAEDRYEKTATSTNSSTRTNYNIQTDENIKNIRLDAYVSPTIPTSASSNKNDDFYSYYNHIVGSPRTIINFTVVNPNYFGLDVGDVVAFAGQDGFDDVLMVFASSWDDFKFMITDVSRSVGSLKITAREI